VFAFHGRNQRFDQAPPCLGRISTHDHLTRAGDAQRGVELRASLRE
jgi:hypothetical protein